MSAMRSILFGQAQSEVFEREIQAYLTPLVERSGLIGAEHSVQLRPGEFRASRVLVGLRASHVEAGWLERHLESADIPSAVLGLLRSDLEGASALLFALEDRDGHSLEFRCYVEWPLDTGPQGISIRGYKWGRKARAPQAPLRITEYTAVQCVKDWIDQVVSPLESEPLSFWVGQVLKRLGPFIPGDLMRVEDRTGSGRRSGCVRADRPGLHVSDLIPSIRLLMLEWGVSPGFVSEWERALASRSSSELSWLAFGRDLQAFPFVTLYCRFNPQDLNFTIQACDESRQALRNAA